MFVPEAVMLKAAKLILLPACAVKLPPTLRVRLVWRLMSTCACKSTDPLVRNPASIAPAETSEMVPVRLPGSTNKIEQAPSPGVGQGSMVLVVATMLMTSGSSNHLPPAPFAALVSTLPDACSALPEVSTKPPLPDRLPPRAEIVPKKRV